VAHRDRCERPDNPEPRSRRSLEELTHAATTETVADAIYHELTLLISITLFVADFFVTTALLASPVTLHYSLGGLLAIFPRRCDISLTGISFWLSNLNSFQ
jgi:hypothetical protein